MAIMDERGGVWHREFVLVSEELWRYFHRRWRELGQEWRGCPRFCLDAGRDELRADVRKLAPDFPGNHIVPV